MAFFVRIRKHLVNLDAIARIEDRSTPSDPEVFVYLTNTEPLMLRGEEASRFMDFLSRQSLVGSPSPAGEMAGLVASTIAGSGQEP